jgi:hypothetical protein
MNKKEEKIEFGKIFNEYKRRMAQPDPVTYVGESVPTDRTADILKFKEKLKPSKDKTMKEYMEQAELPFKNREFRTGASYYGKGRKGFAADEAISPDYKKQVLDKVDRPKYYLDRENDFKREDMVNHIRNNFLPQDIDTKPDYDAPEFSSWRSGAPLPSKAFTQLRNVLNTRENQKVLDQVLPMPKGYGNVKEYLPKSESKFPDQASQTKKVKRSYFNPQTGEYEYEYE